MIKQGAKLQQARLIGASDAVNRRRGALAPAGVGGTGDSRNDHLYNYIEYQGTVAHEFGHTLLLGDAYFSSPITGNQLTSNDEIAQGNFGCDGSIMYSNGKVYANDIEMVLEAFIKNSSQDYYTMLANSEHGELTKSNVIRHSQVFDVNP